MHEEMRHQRHAQPGLRRRNEHGKEFIARPAHHVDAAHAHHVEPLPPGLRARGLVQERHFGQFFRLDPRLAVHQAGVAHRDHFFAEQVFDHGARPDRVAKVDGGVERRVVEHERLGARRQVDADVRVAGVKIDESRNQPARSKGGNRRQFEHAAAPVRHQGKGVVLDALEIFAHLAGVEPPGLGKQNAPPDAVEQGNAEIIFQRGNLPADGALGQR